MLSDGVKSKFTQQVRFADALSTNGRRVFVTLKGREYGPYVIDDRLPDESYLAVLVPVGGENVHVWFYAQDIRPFEIESQPSVMTRR